jgi:putative transposase
MAKKTGLSHMTIGRIWRPFGLQPHRTEIFKLSPDPLLVHKVRDIIGLYRRQRRLIQLAQPLGDRDARQPTHPDTPPPTQSPGLARRSNRRARSSRRGR